MKNGFAIHIMLKIQVRRQNKTPASPKLHKQKPSVLKLNDLPYQGQVYLVEENTSLYL